MCQGVWAILAINDLLTSCPWGPATAHGVGLLTEMCAVNSPQFLRKYIWITLLEYLCWLRPFHYAKNCCPTTCIRATVTPNRSLFGKPPGTSLKMALCWSASIWNSPNFFWKHAVLDKIHVHVFGQPQILENRHFALGLCLQQYISLI